MLDLTSKFESPGPFVERGKRGPIIGQVMAGLARAALEAKAYQPDPLSPEGLVHKAVSEPASTANAPLHRQALAEFQEALGYESALLKLEPRLYDLDGYAAIVLPYRDGLPTDMAGGFRGESQPIRVGGLKARSRKLEPHSLAVIASITNEVLERSQGIEDILYRSAIEDTAAALDRHAFSNSPAVAGVSPPGLLLNALQEPATDAFGAIKGLVTAVAPRAKRPVLLMSKATRVSVEFAMNAMGGFQFPELNTSGFAMGLRVIECNALPNGRVIALDADALAIVLRLDSIRMTGEGLIHEEDVTPLPIVDGAGAMAPQVRELYSSNSSAIRFVWSCDFAWTRPNAISYADVAV
jgi:hypothetical protein